MIETTHMTTGLPENFASLPRDMQFDVLSDQIGNTPMLSVPELDAAAVQKAEYLNPSGSHYDRAYMPTIQYLETSGLIRPGDELRDITSGSAGISLALLGSLLGYPVRITVPDELPPARVEPMVNMDAEVVRAGKGYIKAASEFQRNEIQAHIRDGWRRIRAEDPEMRAVILESGQKRICYINHSENALSPQAFSSIGREMVDQFGAVESPLAVVLAMGNWTTIAGISPIIREAWPNTKLVGFEGTNRENHDNYGTTVDDIPLRFRDDSLLDEQITVTNEERDDMDVRVNSSREQAHQIGHSSLMGLAVAEKLAQQDTAKNPSTPNSGHTVLTIAYDQKSRY